MKNLIVLIISFLILFSCSSNDATFLETGQGFYVLDKAGNDLLDPSNENKLNINMIKIYFIDNGQKIEVSQYDVRQGVVLDNPNGFSISPPWVDPNNPDYRIKYHLLGVGLNTLSTRAEHGDILYTLIEWNEHDTDTIRGIIYSKGSSYIAKMISFNDSIWSPSQDDPIFTIVK